MGCIGNAPISADFQSAANLPQLTSIIIRNDFVLLLSPARPLYWGNSVHSGSRYIIRHTDTVSSYKVCRQLYKYTYHFLHIYYNKNFLFFQIKILIRDIGFEPTTSSFSQQCYNVFILSSAL